VIATGLLLVFAYVSYPQTPIRETRAETDLVHFGDLVDVDVVGSFEFDWRGTLNPEGFLDGLDKLEDPIYAVCRTESDIASDITKGYSKFLRSPQVVVKVVDRSHRAEALISGAVRNPYRFQIRRPVRLNELIVLSGGITDRSSGDIVVFRPASLSCSTRPAVENAEAFVKTNGTTGSQTIKIKISDLLNGVAEANPQIQRGDIVTVIEASPVYIIGGVNNPQQISSRSQTTLSRAIASAGGISKDGLDNKITIYRRSNGQTQTIAADLSRIESKEMEDIQLLPFDIVDVGQKGREKRVFPPNVDNDRSRKDTFALRLKIID